MKGDLEFLNLRMALSSLGLSSSTQTGFEVLRGLQTDRGTP